MPPIWEKKRVLGFGSFGEVVLYQHKDTSECIALKKCSRMLEGEALKRWISEVEFMRELLHDHIVKGKLVPPELMANAGEPPRLAMEYCSKGDLRKKLSELPNICGLEEEDILLMSDHISKAMRHLHGLNIMHRDIKPENITIQDVNGRDVYKLTDLGFAKHHEDHLKFHSIVGTKQYMAPELVLEKEYTNTVDYWSFGTVLSEIITGNRPFSMQKRSLLVWSQIIEGKKDKEIGYYEDAKGKENYATTLPDPHQLCRVLKESFEVLLSKLLCYDPRKRGGNVDNPVLYRWLHEIISSKVIHVRLMKDGQLKSFPYKDNDRVEDLLFSGLGMQRGSTNNSTIPNDMPIRNDSAILLLANGERLTDYSAKLHDIFRNHARRDRIVYLYQDDIPAQTDTFQTPPQTSLVDCLMAGTIQQLSADGFKVMWKQSVHYCHRLKRDATERMTGFIAYLNYNLRRKAILVNCAHEMREYLHKLKATAEFFLFSVSEDIKHYSHQRVGGFGANDLIERWGAAKTEVEEKTQKPEKEVEQLEKRIEETIRFIYETQKKAERHKTVDGLNETIKECDAVYKNFKEECKVKKKEDIDKQPIQKQIKQAKAQYMKYNQDIFNSIREVRKSCMMINEMIQSTENCMANMREVHELVLAHQRRKQKDLWEIINFFFRRQLQVQRQPSTPRSLASPGTPPSAGPTYPGAPAPVFDPQQSMATGPATTANMDSMSIVNQSLQRQSEIDELLRSISTERKQNEEELNSLDWGHLDGS